MNNLIEDLPKIDGTATDDATLDILFMMLAHLRPKKIVEAGTYMGHFSIGAARLLPETEVHTADIKEFFKLEGDPPANFHFYREDFDVMLRKVGEFDFGFIDSGPPFAGGHAEEAIRLRHWSTAWETLTPGGLLVAHDTKNAAGWRGGTLIASQGVTFQIGNGFTIWQKRT